MNRRTVYTYKWPGEKRARGLAMNCHMQDGHLVFFDTIRGHGFKGKIVRDTGDAFTFQSEQCQPGPWEFKALTIEDFRRETSRIVEDGPIIAQAIRTTEDLQEWYRKKFGADAGLYYPEDV